MILVPGTTYKVMMRAHIGDKFIVTGRYLYSIYGQIDPCLYYSHSDEPTITLVFQIDQSYGYDLPKMIICCKDIIHIGTPFILDGTKLITREELWREECLKNLDEIK